MIEATNLKNGTTFLANGMPYKVVKYTHTKLGRGGATVRVTARNLKTGAVEEKTYGSNNKVEDIVTNKRRLQFLYVDGVNAIFMDPVSYEQSEIPVKVIKEELPYIKEGEKADVLLWENEALSIEIPPKVELKVEETAPGVKGNSATNIYKQAKLENGMTLKVPLFINVGDSIRVDTRTAEYVERVK
jgi:elongation factor P